MGPKHGTGKLRTSIQAPDSTFDPEGTGYDMSGAMAASMKPSQVQGKNFGHMGSVKPAPPEARKKYGLPEESYVLLKGRGHESWDKAVAGEEARGFRVVKRGSRYYSIPK